jgi:hypothetical protein
MKRRPSDRKVNYASIVKGNMRKVTGLLGAYGRNLSHNILINTRSGRRKCLTMHYL